MWLLSPYGNQLIRRSRIVIQTKWNPFWSKKILQMKMNGSCCTLKCYIMCPSNERASRVDHKLKGMIRRISQISQISNGVVYLSHQHGCIVERLSRFAIPLLSELLNICFSLFFFLSCVHSFLTWIIETSRHRFKSRSCWWEIQSRKNGKRITKKHLPKKKKERKYCASRRWGFLSRRVESFIGEKSYKDNQRFKSERWMMTVNLYS